MQSILELGEIARTPPAGSAIHTDKDQDLAIYDCFTFYNELDLLQLRLTLLDGLVDKFVICEAGVTHQGTAKPAFFKENVARFAPWIEKIHYIYLEDLGEGDAWARENYQREALIQGLKDASPHDLVVISDVDEIPAPAALDRLAKTLREPIRLEMELFYFALNQRVPETWARAVVARAGDVRSTQALRSPESAALMRPVKDGGWHFSYLSDEDGIRTKLRSFAHTEYSTSRWTSPIHIERCLKYGVDLFGRYRLRLAAPTGFPLAAAELANALPQYWRETGANPWVAEAYRILARARWNLPSDLIDKYPFVALLPALVIQLMRRLRQALILAQGRILRGTRR